MFRVGEVLFFQKVVLFQVWVDFFVNLEGFGVVWEAFWELKGDQNGFKI